MICRLQLPGCTSTATLAVRFPDDDICGACESCALVLGQQIPLRVARLGDETARFSAAKGAPDDR
jgi:hypothetical protein